MRHRPMRRFRSTGMGAPGTGILGYAHLRDDLMSVADTLRHIIQGLRAYPSHWPWTTWRLSSTIQHWEKGSPFVGPRLVSGIVVLPST